MATEKLITVMDSKVDGFVSGMEKAGKASQKTAGQVKQLDKANDNLSKQLPNATSGFKLQKNAAQQLGYQLQDVAVQAQMGVSAFTILGQQGSQLASVMGPGGAMVGAAIALGSALAGVLVKSLGDTSESVEELEKKILKLMESTTLTEEQAAVLIKAENDKNKAAQESIDTLQKQIDISRNQIELQEQVIGNYDKESKTYLNLVAAQELSREELNKYTAEQQLLNAAIEQSNQNIELYSSLVGEEGVVATMAQRDAAQELIESLDEQILKLSLSEKAYFLHNLNVMGVTGALREEAIARYEMIEALNTELEAREANEAFLENFDAKEEAMQAHFDRLDSMRQRDAQRAKRTADRAARDEKKREREKLAVAESSVQLGMALQNAFFEDNKAIAAGLIVADTAVGIQKSLAIMPFNYANVALIAATGAINLANALSSSKGGGGSISSGAAGGGGVSSSQPDIEYSELDVQETTIEEGGTGEVGRVTTIRFATDSGDALLDALAEGLNERQRNS